MLTVDFNQAGLFTGAYYNDGKPILVGDEVEFVWNEHFGKVQAVVCFEQSAFVAKVTSGELKDSSLRISNCILTLAKVYQNCETQKEIGLVTEVNHGARLKYDLSVNEYCVLDTIEGFQVKYNNWCNKQPEELCELLDLSRAFLFRTIKKLISMELLIKDEENRRYQVSRKWIEAKELLKNF